MSFPEPVFPDNSRSGHTDIIAAFPKQNGTSSRTRPDALATVPRNPSPVRRRRGRWWVNTALYVARQPGKIRVGFLKAWRHEWYGDATKAESTDMPGMAGSMTGMDTNHMKSMSGTGFDLMFIDMMIPHHQGAVAMANDALSKAEHAEVKALARKILDAQQKEIGMMTTWKAAWSDTK